MNPKPVKNLPASVRQRLLNFARENKRSFNELVHYYAMERYLYRLSKSRLSNQFILKGALMFRAWDSPVSRPTMDIDMMAKTSNDSSRVIEHIQEIISVEIPNDGIVFDLNSIVTETITEDADYQGIRIRFTGLLDNIKINMQIDLGFGDIVFPKPEKIDLPTILDLPKPRLLGYSKESAIAEKFEAMVKRGTLNSRMKDFYDIWLLINQFDFTKNRMRKAISMTFQRRGASLTDNIVAFTKSFATDKQVQWEAFFKKVNQDDIPSDFFKVVSAIKEFINPIVSDVESSNSSKCVWKAPGPWK